MHIPFRYKSAAIYHLDSLFCRVQFSAVLRKVHPDAIWLTFPELFDYLPRRLSVPVIYDCMDDNLAFGTQRRVLPLLADAEKRLCEKASVVFASSDHLLHVLQQRYGNDLPATVVRNAYGGERLDASVMSERRPAKPSVVIGYIGTLAVVDRRTVLTMLDRIPEASFYAIGPIEPIYDGSDGKKDPVTLWCHERVTLLGPKPHEELYGLMKPVDCLIVPLKLSRLIESVDPIKMYEYVNYGKPIVSVYYPELQRYRPYVDFYEDVDEVVNTIERLMAEGFPAKYTNSQRLEFLEQNSWSSRASQVVDVLRNILHADA